MNVALLEAVQRANKVFHVRICFSRAKHPVSASRQPAPWCLCRRFHLGANTILRLSFSAHRLQREKNGKVKRKRITPWGTPHTTDSWFLFVSQSEAPLGCPARWPTTDIKNKWKEAPWHHMLLSRCVYVCVCVPDYACVQNIFNAQLHPSWIIKSGLFESFLQLIPSAGSMFFFLLVLLPDELMLGMRRYIIHFM